MNDEERLVTIALLLIVCLFTSFLIHTIYSAEEFRQTSEYDCLEKIAKEFCHKRDMDFNKIYCPMYRDIWRSEDFSCVDRDLVHIYSFSLKEERKCAN